MSGLSGFREKGRRAVDRGRTEGRTDGSDGRMGVMDEWMDLKTTNDARKDLADLTRLVQVEVRDDDGRRRRDDRRLLARAAERHRERVVRGLHGSRARSRRRARGVAVRVRGRLSNGTRGARGVVFRGFRVRRLHGRRGRGLAGVRRVVVGHVARVENLAKCVRDAARVCGAGRDACAGGTRGAF